MRVVIIGQKWLGERVLQMVLKAGYDLVRVIAPEGDRLNAMAGHSDLIVSAPCALVKLRFGGVGYHPSLLPLYRGKHAITDAIKDNQKVVGGSVYQIDQGWDTGPILLQDWCFVREGEDPASLWRRALAPLGLELISRVLGHMEAFGSWPDPQPQAI